MTVGAALVLWALAVDAGAPVERAEGFGHARTFFGHREAVSALAFAGDGKLLATGSQDGTVLLWETESGQLKATLKGHRVAPAALAFSPDGALLASAGKDYQLKVWEVPSGKERKTVLCSGELSSLAFHPSGRQLAVADSSNELRLYDTSSWAPLRSMRGSFAAYAAGGALLLAVDGERIQVLDGTTGALKAMVKVGQPVHELAVRDGKRALVRAGPRRAVSLWDLAAAKSVAELGKPAAPVTSLSQLPDGTWLGGGEDRRVHFWDGASLAERGYLPATMLPFVAASPNGQYVAAGDGALVRIWSRP